VSQGRGRPDTAPQPELADTRQLPAETREFLLGLVIPTDPADLQDLAPDDRVFLAGILKKLKGGKLEIPVLPQAALQIARLLGNPNTQTAEYVRVLAADPALSVEVLRLANSAYYGFANPARSVRDAVVRVGLNQIRGLLVVAHLKSKVLQGGIFHREAGWLADLSMALAQLGRLLAPQLGLEPDVAFTRGLLMHVEHFVVLGTVADVSKEHRKKIEPTEDALFEAFRRFGPRVRALAARVWDLEGFFEAPQEQDELDPLYADLRRALVAHWAGEEDPEAESLARIPAARLQDALRRVSQVGTFAAGPETAVSSGHP
jgi:HD-like signal output (HDOD) protein